MVVQRPFPGQEKSVISFGGIKGVKASYKRKSRVKVKFSCMSFGKSLG
jgi:hypothetical protein